MRRIVIIAIVLVATGGAAVAVVATLHATTRAAATPLNPARGDPAATTQAALLAAPLDRFGLALLADEARTTAATWSSRRSRSMPCSRCC